MATLTLCPKCKAMIEGDSLFCDQCGEELMVCSSCEGFKRGKRCNTCGSQLITARQKASAQPAQPLQPVVSQPVAANPVPPVSSIEASLKPRESPAVSAQPLPEPGHVTCPQIGRIRLSPGLHLGRENSPYAEYLLPYRQISRRHALFNKNGNEWTVTDLGSSCGTMVNGQPCIPNVPVSFKVGDIITFYDLNFTVSD